MRPKLLRQVDEVNSELENASSNNLLNSVGSGMNPKTGSGDSSDPAANHIVKKDFPRNPINKLQIT